MFPDDRDLDAAGELDFFAVLVEPVGDDRLGAVFVGDHFLRGESGGVVELLIVGPGGAAAGAKILG